MDYKYIEQLLERYWACETSMEEEQILRAFFRQKEVPAHLLPYKSLFAYEDAAADLHLGEDFDERILAQVERPSVKARRLPMRRRMMPLFKAAAVVAVMLSLGTPSTPLTAADRPTTTTTLTRTPTPTRSRPMGPSRRHCRSCRRVSRNRRCMTVTASPTPPLNRQSNETHMAHRVSAGTHRHRHAGTGLRLTLHGGA